MEFALKLVLITDFIIGTIIENIIQILPEIRVMEVIIFGSLGMLTLSLDQSQRCVKIAIKNPKNPMYPAKDRYRYAMSPKPPRRSMRLVTFTQNASHVRTHATAVTIIFFFSDC